MKREGRPLGPIDPAIQELQRRLLQIRDNPEMQDDIARRNQEATDANVRREAERQQDRVTNAMRISRMGKRHEDRTFESMTVTKYNFKAIESARKVVDNPRLGLGLHGPPGTGKTHITSAIAHDVILRGIPAIVDSVGFLLRRIQSTYEAGSKTTEASLFDSLVSVDILVLDDLGKERITPWSAQMMWEIINSRYERENPVVITSNLNIAKLTQRYNTKMPGIDEYTLPSMWDRLQEMCPEWIEVRGESYRTQNKPKTG